MSPGVAEIEFRDRATSHTTSMTCNVMFFAVRHFLCQIESLNVCGLFAFAAKRMMCWARMESGGWRPKGQGENRVQTEESRWWMQRAED